MIESIFDLHLDDLKEIKAIDPKKTWVVSEVVLGVASRRNLFDKHLKCK
jgi:hypothetical protein